MIEWLKWLSDSLLVVLGIGIIVTAVVLGLFLEMILIDKLSELIVKRKERIKHDKQSYNNGQADG